MRHELEILDGGGTKDATAALKAKERWQYHVIGMAGVFKNGKRYARGETILLDVDTAKNFIAAGDIE